MLLSSVVSVVEFDAVLSEDAQKKQLQNTIIQIFQEMSDQLKKQMLSKLMALNIQLMSMKKIGSIRMYFLCHSLEALVALRKLFDDGDLKTIIEEFFNALITSRLSERLDPIKLQVLARRRMAHDLTMRTPFFTQVESNVRARTVTGWAAATATRHTTAQRHIPVS